MHPSQSALLAKVHMTRQESGTLAFTLVELIVSLSIVAVLVAMLLTTMGRGKVRTKEALCTSNLRQVYSGLNLYLADNQGRFPAGVIWPERLSQVWNSKEFLGGVDGRDTNALPARMRPLFPYLGASKVFRCPADVGYDSVTKGGFLLRPSLFEVLGLSYLYNAGELIDGAPQSTDGLGGKQLEWVKRSARYALAYEPPALSPDPRHPDSYLVYWHRARKPGSAHGMTDNERGPRVSPVLFVDGHVTFIDCSGSYGTFPTSIETRQ